ncbi:hypothetical protein C1A50_3084 [Paenibacillus polymyxa]|nr:hypothetical protein C1A50_3084 [Paenibacillus polymyxa]
MDVIRMDMLFFFKHLDSSGFEQVLYHSMSKLFKVCPPL